MKTNIPFTPSGERNHYVVVREKNGGSSSSSAKGTQNAEQVTVLGQRSTRGTKLPHYMNGCNGSIFGNRMNHSGAQAGINARQNAARASQQAQAQVGGGMFSGGLSSADAGMMMAMQALNGGMGLIGKGLSAFSAPAQTKAPAEKPKADAPAAPSMDAGRVDVGGDAAADISVSDAVVGNMKSATDPTALRGEIQTARTLLGQYQGQLDKMEASQEYKDAQQNVDKYKADFDAKTKLADNANKAFTDAQAQVDGAQTGVNSALSVLQNASKNCADLFTSWQKLEKELDAMDESDPNYQAKKQAVGEAKASYDQAIEAEAKAKTDVANAKANLDAKLELRSKRKEAANKAKQAMDTAQQNKTDAENKYNAAKKQIDDHKALKDKYDSLEKAIKEQENRLKAMDRKAEHAIESKQRQNDIARQYMTHLENRYGEHDKDGKFTGFGADAKEIENLYNEKQGNIDRRNKEMDAIISGEMQLGDVATGQFVTVDGVRYVKQANGNFKANGQQEIDEQTLIQRIKLTHKSDYASSIQYEES